jgi:hypothetical protein
LQIAESLVAGHAPREASVKQFIPREIQLWQQTLAAKVALCLMSLEFFRAAGGKAIRYFTGKRTESGWAAAAPELSLYDQHAWNAMATETRQRRRALAASRRLWSSNDGFTLSGTRGI